MALVLFADKAAAAAAGAELEDDEAEDLSAGSDACLPCPAGFAGGCIDDEILSCAAKAADKLLSLPAEEDDVAAIAAPRGACCMTSTV